MILKTLTSFILLFCSFSFATDHNEPDLLNSFYKDRDGNGADIYHVFAYPSENRENLNLVLNLAPVPDTGRFEPTSVQRIFMRPTTAPDIRTDLLPNIDPTLNPIKAVKEATNYLKAYKKYILDPLIAPISDVLGIGLRPAFNQTHTPEIFIRYNAIGMKAKITFKNFHFEVPGDAEVVANSNGRETDPTKLQMYNFRGIKIFVGGRDDAFFNDIGGFFRSINWQTAVGLADRKREFRWEGDVSYLASAEEKESGNRKKGLIGKNNEVVYNAKDWREHNNVNTLSFQIPLKYLSANLEEERLLRIWVESYLTREAFNKIAGTKGINLPAKEKAQPSIPSEGVYE